MRRAGELELALNGVANLIERNLPFRYQLFWIEHADEQL